MNEPRFPLIRSWLDKLKPKPLPPKERTWGDVFKDACWGAVKSCLRTFLHLLEWMLK